MHPTTFMKLIRCLFLVLGFRKALIPKHVTTISPPPKWTSHPITQSNDYNFNYKKRTKYINYLKA